MTPGTRSALVALACFACSGPHACGQVPAALPGQVPNTITVVQPSAPLPADLPTIVANFQRMDGEIEALEARVLRVNDGIVEVASMARNTGAGVRNADRAIANVGGTARSNSGLAAHLVAEADTAARHVEAASREMQGLQHMVQEAEISAHMTGAQNTDIGNSIGQIESDIAEFLPGVGGLTGRMGRAEHVVGGYDQELHRPQGLDNMVARSLRRNFKTATKRITDLETEVRAGGPFDDAASAPSPAAALLSPATR